MVTVEKTMKVAVPASEAWELIADFKNIYRVSPLVERSPLIGEKEQGVGATRHCHFKDKTSVVETVVDWQEGRSYTVELSEMTMPLKKAQGTLRVDPAGSGTSYITMIMDFIPKGGPLGWVMGAVMMKPMMGRMLNKTLQSFSAHLLEKAGK